MSGDTYNFRAPGGRQLLRFEILEGPRAGEVLQVPMPEPGEPPVLIGRSRDCAIWIDAQNISRRNTEILSGPDRRPMIRDMGSVNGTLVNGQAISQTQPMPLKPGDHIRVGLTALVFSGLIAPPPPPPPRPQVPVSTAATFVSEPFIPAPPVLPNQGAARPATLLGTYYIYLIMRIGGQRYQLEGADITVGRGQTNDIVVDSNSISRQHARLQRTPAGVYVQDMGSTNKTFVNGMPADGPVLLHDGDVVRFGEVEADFKLETQRVTQTFSLFNRATLKTFAADPAAEVTTPDASELGYDAVEQTFVEAPEEQTFIGNTVGPQRKDTARVPGRSQLEQSETVLDLDIRVVGRQLRQTGDAVPENNRPASGEVARLEGVFLSEGFGRAKETILNNVRLGLKGGELVTLVGPSGSGKTELLQIMSGARAAERGQVVIMDRVLPVLGSGSLANPEVEREMARWRLHSVGYLTSQLDLIPKQSGLEHVMWVLEQAGYGRDPIERRDKALAQLALVGLTDPEVVQLRPPDLNRTERKLVALARALALDPPLLLVDEPIGSVPSSSADRIFKVLKDLAAKGTTVFMATIDPVWSRNADRQIEILDGTIVGSLS